MTYKTAKLRIEIAKALYDKKAVLITGNTGVGKTFLAKEAISELSKKEYSCFPESTDQAVVTEIIPCHNSITYEDIVGGISIKTQEGELLFRYTDKILVETIKKAAEAYHEKKGNRYVLLLDDIHRSNISSLMGDAIAAVGVQSGIKHIHLNTGTKIEVTPNFYIIATYNSAESGATPLSVAVFEKFFVIELVPDIDYITDDEQSENAALYEQVREMIMNHLDFQLNAQKHDRNAYLPGPGYFTGENVKTKIKYLLIPTLKQYIADGILDREAEQSIKLLESLCNSNKRVSSKKTSCFGDFKVGVSAEQFINEESTRASSSIPIENIIGRIIEQGLLSDDAIKIWILFSRRVCYREGVINGVTYLATLIANRLQHDNIRRGNIITGRNLYNGGTISVDGETYFFTGGYHPTDYVKEACWNNEEEYKLGESFGGDLVIFRIVWQYYKALIHEYSQYLKNTPTDAVKEKLLSYIQDEWDHFFEDFKKIEPAPFSKKNMESREWKRIEAEHNKEANKDVRKLIGQLTILWSNPGDELTLSGGERVVLEGIEDMIDKNRYQEYRDAMEMLGIKQMILQGPPGTSKTFSAKEFIKYMAKDCCDQELAEIQITDYLQKKSFCERIKKGKSVPEVAWDIVQFHPSYGYEDFIRGIQVSTSERTNAIKYETVNKVLGSISELARANDGTKFFLIIDEINRANLATVFGELIYGLEYRSEKVATPYTVDNSNRISIPENLYIIGTMNTADKTIGGIDYAIRRRFLFFELLPDESIIKTYNEDLGKMQIDLNEKACNLFINVSKLFESDYLNPEYRKEDVQIGHTYFLVDSEEELLRRFEYQIIPILKEYYKDGVISYDVEMGDEGFVGFLNCINGEINMTTNENSIDNIFKSLISETGVAHERMAES